MKRLMLAHAFRYVDRVVFHVGDDNVDLAQGHGEHRRPPDRCDVRSRTAPGARSSTWSSRSRARVLRRGRWPTAPDHESARPWRVKTGGVRDSPRPVRAQLYAFCLGLLALPSAVAGNTPPIPPPDPAALAAARQLVEQLPIDGMASAPFSTLPRTVTDNALAWLDNSRPDLSDDGELHRLFAANVELEARKQLAACVPHAEEALADWLARGIVAADLREITTFVSTSSGRSLAGILAGAGNVASDALGRCAYLAMFPSLASMLDEAIESDDLRRRVNSQPARPAQS